MPSFVSCHTRDSVEAFGRVARAACGSRSRRPSLAENRKVAGVEEQGERLRAASPRTGMRAPSQIDTAVRAANTDAADRQGRVGAHQDERVRVRELAARDEVGQRRVARRPPEQRQALDHERQQVDRPQLTKEDHRQVHRAAGEIGRRSSAACGRAGRRAPRRSDRTGRPAGSGRSSRRRRRATACPPPIVATIAVTAMNPTQSPSERHRHRREQPGERRGA